MKQMLRGFVLLVLTSGSAHAASFTPLGDLAGGSVSSFASGVSDDGSVVVGSSASAAGTEAFRWTGGVMTGLGDLPGGIFSSHANGVSADGSVVVGLGRSPSGDEAFMWADGVMTGLGSLPSPSFGSQANGVSANGSVVVGSSNSTFPIVGSTQSAFGIQAFRWTGGVMTGLGLLPGGDWFTTARGVSADGSVVVGFGAFSQTVGGYEAFRWTAGVMTRLGDLPGGGFSSEANGVSADGSVVVGWSSSASGDQAFRWTGGVMTGLGYLGGASLSEASATSADGSVVVGSSVGAAGPEAFVWTAGGGMERLLDVLVARGASGMTGWKLSGATAISADGQWIAGTGVNPLGHSEAFLANISPIPIPAAAWLLSGALGLLAVARRRAAQ